MDRSLAAENLAALLQNNRGEIESAWIDGLLARTDSLYRDVLSALLQE